MFGLLNDVILEEIWPSLCSMNHMTCEELHTQRIWFKLWNYIFCEFFQTVKSHRMFDLTGTEELGCLTRPGAMSVMSVLPPPLDQWEAGGISWVWQSRPMTRVACRRLGVGATVIRLRSSGSQSRDSAWDPPHKSTLGKWKCRPAWPGGEGILLWQQVEESVQHCAKPVFYLSTWGKLWLTDSLAY